MIATGYMISPSSGRAAATTAVPHISYKKIALRVRVLLPYIYCCLYVFWNTSLYLSVYAYIHARGAPARGQTHRRWPKPRAFSQVAEFNNTTTFCAAASGPALGEERVNTLWCCIFITRRLKDLLF